MLNALGVDESFKKSCIYHSIVNHHDINIFVDDDNDVCILKAGCQIAT